MAHFGGLRINKTESPDKTPYSIYLIEESEEPLLFNRNYPRNYIQIASIDPARKNYALRIERRYKDKVLTVVFDKLVVEKIISCGKETINATYNNINKFLDKYNEYLSQCDYILVERQLPQNYKATRIAQHTISYFMFRLLDSRAIILEVDPRLKGKMLNAPKGMNERGLKLWTVDIIRELLITRNDNFALQVMNYFKRKQDDLADTVAQIEAIVLLLNLTIS